MQANSLSTENDARPSVPHSALAALLLHRRGHWWPLFLAISTPRPMG